MLIIIAIFGCEKEKTDYPPPTIEFITESGFVFNDTILEIGENFKIGIKASNPNVNLTNFIIRVQSDELETYLDSGMNTPNLHFERNITKGIKESEKWIFIIRDKDGKSAEVSINIIKDSSSAFGNIKYYANIEMGAQNSSVGSFYSLTNDSVYTLSSAFANQNKIDLCYYYDFIDTDENTIASPGANIDASVYTGANALANWTSRRTTRFKVANISENDFLNANNDSLLIVSYGQSDGNRKAKNLKTTDIFSFKNNDGKVGLFKVNTITGTDAGTVNISIKIQE
ncbi:MAG: hypothetical protein K9J13_10845 [Saprospiraceae bacterium]|nr:hypothetical protein [Saprospiraceae bacterium]